MNWIVNAAQHGRRDTDMVISERSAAHEVIVRVTDRGLGMRSQSLASICRPFVQHTRGLGSKAQMKGSNCLGLYIAREIAGRHGGQIHVASREAEGTTLTVTLPLHYGRKG